MEVAAEEAGEEGREEVIKFSNKICIFVYLFFLLTKLLLSYYLQSVLFKKAHFVQQTH